MHSHIISAVASKRPPCPRGRPLGRVSTGKKAFVPNSFFHQANSRCSKIRFARQYSNLSFRLLISDTYSMGHCCIEAIRSVTHLVLARGAFLSSVSYLKASPSSSFLRSTLRPSRHCGTRKRSVPVRVHSVRKSSGFAGSCCQAPVSNPFLTHGTVESPAKLFFKHFHFGAKFRECGRLQSVQQGSKPTPISG